MGQVSEAVGLSAVFKGQLVAESYEAGVTVSEVAARHGVGRQQLYGWRHLVKAGQLALPNGIHAEYAEVVVEDAPKAEGAGVDIMAEAPATGFPAGGISGGIEVDLAGGFVRFPSDVCVERLVAVIAGLRQAR